MNRIARVAAILRRWDPIGVAPGQFAPADEYDGYAPHIVSMVRQGCSCADLQAHLGHLRRNIIGVEPNDRKDEDTAREIVVALGEG
jgi:hypothetical protein